MDADSDSGLNAAPDKGRASSRRATQIKLIKWGVVLFSAFAIAFTPVPSGITAQSWRLLAIFVATIIGSIVRPVSSAAMVLLGVTAIALTGALPVDEALRGYADPVVWLVLAAFFIARGMIKTGLGRRIALIFIRAIGHHSLGLGYALAATSTVLASVVPSVGARSGGIIFPIAKSLAEAYESRPGQTALRLGAFLSVVLYQCEVVICAIFLTGQASNPIIAKFALQETGINLTYSRWLAGAIVPGLLSLIIVPLVIYRLFPPEIKHTPAAAEFATAELRRIGPMTRAEKMMLAVFMLVASLWIIGDKLPSLTGGRVPAIHYAVVALVGI